MSNCCAGHFRHRGGDPARVAAVAGNPPLGGGGPQPPSGAAGRLRQLRAGDRLPAAAAPAPLPQR